MACYSARIRVDTFTPSKSQRRAMKHNAHLTREASTPWATEEQYQLFRRYLNARHADGGMADMDVFEFSAMIEETPVRSRVIEYYRPDPTTNGRRELAACCLTDILDDGLSMVYSFFQPDMQHCSPGTFIILDHIEIAREAGLPYVYLGYWVPGSPKMDYKARFDALEIYRDGAWVPLGKQASFAPPPAPVETVPIADQVAGIDLPDLASPTTSAKEI